MAGCMIVILILPLDNKFLQMYHSISTSLMPVNYTRGKSSQEIIASDAPQAMVLHAVEH
jgi:hypothetical protein